MKILTVYNQDYEEKQNQAFNRAVEYLKKQGHNLKLDLDLRKGSGNKAEDLDKFQSKLDKAIKDTDIIFTEISNADAKVGFDIAKAISEKKIVVALQKEDKKERMFSSIHGSNERNLIIMKYTESNILDVVNQALEDAKSKLDTKFILIISPEIDRYLDWAAQTKRMHKAQIVRNAIENTLKRDKEYKTYLQG